LSRQYSKVQNLLDGKSVVVCAPTDVLVFLSISPSGGISLVSATRGMLCECLGHKLEQTGEHSAAAAGWQERGGLRSNRCVNCLILWLLRHEACYVNALDTGLSKEG
jgi:hypothetical protein